MSAIKVLDMASTAEKAGRRKMIGRTLLYIATVKYFKAIFQVLYKNGGKIKTPKQVYKFFFSVIYKFTNKRRVRKSCFEQEEAILKGFSWSDRNKWLLNSSKNKDGRRD